MLLFFKEQDRLKNILSQTKTDSTFVARQILDGLLISNELEG